MEKSPEELKEVIKGTITVNAILDINAMQGYRLGQTQDFGSRTIKWEANKNIIIRAEKWHEPFPDRSTVSVWEGSYNREKFRVDESGDLLYKGRGKTKTYSHFRFQNRQDGSKNNSGWSVKYKKHQEHSSNAEIRNKSHICFWHRPNEYNAFSKFNFKYTNDITRVEPGSFGNSLPVEWSVGDKTVLEENGFSKELFNALSREEHINKPLLTNSNIFIDNNSQNNEIISPKKYKNRFPDKITNFNPSTDTLEIDADSFGIDSSATFAAAKNRTELKKLAKKDFDFLYDQEKGGLYFNENGADKGFGDGGIIAILKGAPDLTSGSLEFT